MLTSFFDLCPPPADTNTNHKRVEEQRENTVKALTERRAAKIKELRSAAEQLDQKPGDADLKKRYTELDAEIRDIDERIERAKRIEALTPVTNERGDLDQEDRNLTPGQRKDDPLVDTDAKGFSVLRMLDCRLENRQLTGIEAEVHAALEERAAKQNRKVRGLAIPMGLRCDINLAHRAATRMGRSFETRDLTLTTGAGAVATQVAPTLIELLRKRAVVQNLGAVVLADMVGSFAIPKETAEPTYEWVAEGSAASKSNGTIGQVTFSAKTLTAWTSMTRRFIKQSSIDAEMFARYQLINGAARGLDFGALAGPGTTNNVTGILYDTDTNLVAIGTNGGALTWAKVVEFETAIATDNADAGTMAWVVNAATRGHLKTTVKVSGYPLFLMENGEANGYPVAVSNQMPSNLTKGTGTALSGAVFGDFSKLVIALWGGLDLLVDPYSEGTTGNVRVISHQDCDVNRIHDEAFSRCVDIAA